MRGGGFSWGYCPELYCVCLQVQKTRENITQRNLLVSSIPFCTISGEEQINCCSQGDEKLPKSEMCEQFPGLVSQDHQFRRQVKGFASLFFFFSFFFFFFGAHLAAAWKLTNCLIPQSICPYTSIWPSGRKKYSFVYRCAFQCLSLCLTVGWLFLYTREMVSRYKLLTTAEPKSCDWTETDVA